MLIVLVGLLVPVLAAAPFYVLDSRAEQRADEAAAQRRAHEVGASGPAELGADRTASDEVSGEVAHDDDRRDALVANEPIDQAHEDTVPALPFPTQPTAESIEQEVPTTTAIQYPSAEHPSASGEAVMDEPRVEHADQAPEGVETSAA
ncbi:hypothetical protein GCM10027563_43380 [Parasphingorhabdus pacifica]